MNKTFDLDFCYKGSRQYVHGTDIFAKLTKRYEEEIHNIDIAFHGITKNNMTFSTEKPVEEDVKVTFRCTQKTEKIRLFGYENDKSVSCRYDYWEEKIVESSSINPSESSIILDDSTEYSFIEHIVAMNKALVEKLYPEANGKWYFTRLQLKRNVEMSLISSLKLVLESNFQFKLTKSVIVVNGENLGFIYFSLVSKGS